MEIKARCRIDLDSVRALYHLALFKKSNPKTRMTIYTSTICALIAIVILEGILWRFSPKMFITLGVGVFTLLLLYFLYYFAPVIQYRQMTKIKNVENLYTFGEDILTVISESNEFHGESEIAYAFFVKAYETSKYFFLFQSNRQTFAVDKSTVEGGTAEDIRARLTAALGEKYIRCKY